MSSCPLPYFPKLEHSRINDSYLILFICRARLFATPTYSRARATSPAGGKDGMSVPADVRAPPERPSGSQFTLPTWSRQAPPVPMTNGSPKTAPPPRRLEPIIVPPVEPSRPSRSLADWMILAGMFIFLVILSHGQMTTANELKKLNERMGPAQLGVSPATVPPLRRCRPLLIRLVRRIHRQTPRRIHRPLPQQCSPNTSTWWIRSRSLAVRK